LLYLGFGLIAGLGRFFRAWSSDSAPCSDG
jgi:hypothetical protein